MKMTSSVYGSCDTVRAFLGKSSTVSDEEITKVAASFGVIPMDKVHPFLVAQRIEKDAANAASGG